MLFVALRAAGVPHPPLPVGVAFAVYATARVLTIVEVTPGGVGVTEVVYISLFSWVAGPQYKEEVVAGVLVYRALTYVGPLLIGAVCYIIWRLRKPWRVPAASTATR